jgi:hypothetical protein
MPPGHCRNVLLVQSTACRAGLECTKLLNAVYTFYVYQSLLKFSDCQKNTISSIKTLLKSLKQFEHKLSKSEENNISEVVSLLSF